MKKTRTILARGVDRSDRCNSGVFGNPWPMDFVPCYETLGIHSAAASICPSEDRSTIGEACIISPRWIHRSVTRAFA